MQSSFIAIGVDLGGTNTRVAGIHSKGNILYKLSRPTQADHGSHFVVHQMELLIQESLKKVKYKPLAIGIGSPGCIDLKKGSVLYATDNLPDWEGTPLRQIFQKKFRLPVFVNNDVNMITYGESRIGAGKGIDNFICLALGTGVGGGMVLNGELYFGHDYYAGEFGHITISHDGPKCNCGSRGCIESYVGTSAIIKQAKEVIQQNPSSLLSKLAVKDPITPELIFHAAQQDDKTSQKLFSDIGFYLGIGIANILNMISPERIAISGGVSMAWKYLYPSVLNAIRQYGLFGKKRSPEIVPAKLGQEAGLIGAGLYAIHQL